MTCLLGVGATSASGCGSNGTEGGAGGGSAQETTRSTDQALSAAPVCISIQRGLSGTVADTLLANKTPAANYGTSAALLTGLVSATQRESLLRFDLSAIPAGATINSAILSLYETALISGSADIRAHRVTTAWSEATVTWQSFNQAFNASNDAVFSNANNPASTSALVPLVQSWVSGAQPNYGLLLEQAYFGTNVTQFQSSESATVAQRPRLDVCYTVTCGAGFADCDGKGQNGCETAITTTTSCGACGKTCAFTNAAPACIAGSCGIASCNAGFGDCDGNTATGCETSLATATNCGGCGVACAAANGTSSCANGTCALLGCNSGFFDCDGNTANGCEALPCGNGQHCGHGTECSSGVCQNGICAAPTCTDGVQNGAESSTDCGGTTCPPCSTGLGCLVGSDCATGVCRAGICAPASCNDSVKNGSETGVDCGGPSCAPCADGNGCTTASDCQGGVCVGGSCQTSVCNDGVKNGSETGVDCGGSSCKPCPDGIGCVGGADCTNQICVNNVCQMASCTDGVKNGAESDVDCGGSCGPCGVAQLCATSADCSTGVCVNGHCQPPTCSDGVQNGNETGLDCGGSCFVAEICDGVDNDCNGTVDDGLGTTTCGIGACQVTVPSCTGGSATACVPGTPGVEICDGLLDDDCDGTVDNGCACTNGQVQSCYTGSAATSSVGTCHNGNQTCVMGQWAACVGEQLPVGETCDGLDNDCNGQDDDGLGSTICGVGSCQALVQNCVAGQVQTCTPGKPSAETCDGQDNDCNGQVDDGLGTINCGVGACAASVAACTNGVSGVCVAGSPTAESCDGIDNDCDGAIDNGNPGGGLGCNTGNSGACSAGTTVCTAGGITCHQTTQPTAESCDGIDNDCDGVVDNGNPGGGLGCSTGNLGICAAGTTVCSTGHVTCSQNAQPGVESCNGLDDDCDGATDNGNPGGGQACNTGLLGACSGGMTACAAGQIACNQNVQPVAEVCDGVIDNNCNGQNDEGCNCVNGSTQSCYGGAAGTAGVGACHTGTQTCVNGNFGACVGQVIPTAETCDGVDNNCNGQTDDGLGTISCGVGQCGNTVAACVNGHAGTCAPKAASAELCDGLDNDCDGVVDNGNPGSGAACGTGKQGVCSAGLTACTAGAIVCNQTTAATVETCDGLDNDCNGVVDNGNPSGGAACSTGQQGICSAGTTACTGGAVVCNRNQNPTTETCDGLDNDCNGVVDNGNPSGGAACSTGQLGVCSAGVTACTGGAVICNRTTSPSAETCDGKDNDCNGVVDNGNPGGGAGCSTGLQGICSAGTTTCTAGVIACTQTQTAKTETCNGLDDDCNGVVDNGNPGSGAACSTGQLGVCAAGTTTCTAGSLACTRTQAPTTETCNGLDDDCNGTVDNGNPGAGVACTTGQSGICSAGTTACVSGAVACNRTSSPVVESCNGLDDDCNGVIDDGCNVPAGPTTLVFLPMDGAGAVANDNSSADFVNFAGAGVSFLPNLAPSISALLPRYGTGSGSFKNGYLKTASSPANVIGNADFTIEFWVKYSGALDTFGSIVLSGSGWDITLGNTNYNNTADFSFNNQSARWWGGTVGWGVLPTGVWSHLSISRSGTSLYTHLNGVWKATATIAAGARLEGVASTSVLTVGSFAPAYLDDLLITVGGVKHTVANFTPAQQTAVPYIYLPMDGPGDGENLSADFRNSVPGGPVVSLVGAPAISSTLAGCAGCGNFMAGSLTTPVATASAIGTRDFTMEFWVKNASLETFGSPVISSANGATSFWDISLGNANYNGNADFAYYTTENGGARFWGGDISWGVVPLNTWTHLSLTRLGTSLITHKNGVLVSTLTIPATTRMEGPTATSAAITIGSHPSYLDDVMITLGTARHTTANFSVVRSTNFPRLVASPEPHVFLPLDGAAASTSFPNFAASSAAFTATGTPSITTSTVKFGGASGNFQTGSIATASSADNVIGTRDFTMEFWVNYSAQGTFGTPVIAGNGWDISLGNTNYNANADFAFANQSARWWGGTVSWGAVAKNTWVHLALSRSGDRLYTHKNGTLISVVAISPSANMEAGALASAITVGASPSYLDDVVLTLGTAKYSTADFAVPVVQPKSFMYFPMDGANLATTFTNFGTGPVVTKVSSPFLTNATAVHGGVSANLTGGSLTTAASSAYKLGTADFTIEFWVKNSFLETFGSTVISGSGWDISLGNANYNGNADFAFYPTETGGYRHWGGDIGWGVLPLNTWVHLSLTRSGLRLYTHKNGVLVATRAMLATDSMEGPNATSTVAIGTHPSFIDDLTVTIGTARHTSANFTVYP